MCKGCHQRQEFALFYSLLAYSLYLCLFLFFRRAHHQRARPCLNGYNRGKASVLFIFLKADGKDLHSRIQAQWPSPVFRTFRSFHDMGGGAIDIAKKHIYGVPVSKRLLYAK